MWPRLTLIVILLLASSAFSGRTSGGGSRSGGYGGGRTNSHSYPSSNHLSGTGTSHGNSYSGTHSYPSSDGLSGTNSGRSQSSYNSHSGSYGQKTEIHHHYHYRPPLQINYGSVPHPVYQGRLPTYVYEYRDSGSRFDNLLTGLALYNLGRMSANQHHGYHNREYSGIPGEVCKLGIRKSNGDYEETRVDCRLMSSFIWDEQSSNPVAPNTHKTETNVTEVRTVVASNSTNGTTTVITSTVTVKDASDMKGPSLQVTKDMTCYMIRVSTYSPMKKTVDCALLQTYATSSLHRSRAVRSVPAATLVALSFMYLNYHQMLPVY